MKIIKNKEISIDKWHILLEASPYSSPFQTPQFFEFFNAVENFTSDVFAIEVGEEYKALVVVSIQMEKGIKSYFSKRGIIYGGPLVVSNGQDYLTGLIKGMELFYKKNLIYLETRNSFDYSYYKNVFINLGYKYLPYLNFKIPLTDNDLLLKNFKSEKRRQIRKGLKKGVKFLISNNEEQIIELYSILKEIYHNRAKKPIPSKNYFIKLNNLFIENNSGFFIVVLYKDKVIGGSVCPLKNGVIYDWYRGGDDRKYKKVYPSTIAAYAGMKIGIEMGLTEFDFMGAGLKTKPYSVRDFKSQFGGDLVEHGRYLKILNPLIYKVGKIGLNVLSKLK